MRKALLVCLVIVLSIPLFASSPVLLDAKIVTEVLGWGETVTGIRLEYSEEIANSSIVRDRTFSVKGGQKLDAVYVSRSGRKGDASAYGRYVFLDFCQESADWADNESYVTFISNGKTRPESEPVTVIQNGELRTADGDVAGPREITTSGEIRTGIDEFVSVKYESSLLDDGIDFYYHLYIPEGYESKDEGLDDIPLIVHFPSGDVNYKDYSGKYYGAIFSHNDVTSWITPEAQEAHPAFVLTYGASVRVFCQGDIYLDIIDKLLQEYNIDPERIYGISIAGGTTDMRKMAIDYPDVFAGLVSVSFDYAKMFTDAKSVEVKELVESRTGKTYSNKEDFGVDAARLLMDIVPVWCFMSEDDTTTQPTVREDGTKIPSILDTGVKLRDLGYNVDIAYGENGELMWNGRLEGKALENQSARQLERAEKAGAEHLITIFMANTIRLNGHCAWTVVYPDAKVHDWLFSQVNDKPYVPEE